MKINDSLKEYIENKYGSEVSAELAVYTLELAEKYKDDTGQIDHRVNERVRKISDKKGGEQ